MTYQILLIVATDKGHIGMQLLGGYSSQDVCEVERAKLDERLNVGAGAMIAHPALAYKTVCVRKS